MNQATYRGKFPNDNAKVCFYDLTPEQGWAVGETRPVSDELAADIARDFPEYFEFSDVTDVSDASPRPTPKPSKQPAAPAQE